ncbi:MAG: tryptophan synthase subunit alpha [Candidatus Dormiibacterota bacterium]
MTAIAASPRFANAFRERQADRLPGVIPFLTAGFPGREDTVRLLLACQRGGGLAAEVGIPFSDPLADGPTIQRSGWRALEQGMTPRLALAQLAEARAAGLSLPIAVMTYVNPVLSMGVEAFATGCAEAGVDGVILVDAPVEEAGELAAVLGHHGLAHIPLVAPTTPTARLQMVAATASAFVYCVSVTGTTGARDRVSSRAIDLLARVRSVSPLPRALGFGISRPEHVSALAGHCEAVVVGSALIDALERGSDHDASRVVESFVRNLRGKGAEPR